MACSPPVISRGKWGAAAPKKETPICGAVKKVIIHHTALKGCNNLEDCKKQLHSIQKNHMTDRNFDDIGYNFLVAADGTLFEGRGWALSGAHTLGHNHDSVGISFMGNFEEDDPSQKAIDAVKGLLEFGVSSCHVDAKYDLKGHKDFRATACPGKKLYAELSRLKSSP